MRKQYAGETNPPNKFYGWNLVAVMPKRYSDYRIILSLLALLVPPFNNIYGHLININLQNKKERNK